MAVGQSFVLKLKPIGWGTLVYPKGNIIYKIINKIDGKVYIGQTKYFKARIGVHVRSLNENKHQNVYLQRAFNKYGFSTFYMEVLEFVEDLGKLTEREQHWSDYYKSYERNNGYNLLKDVRSPWHGPKSEEHKRKISLAHIGIGHTEEVKKKIAKAVSEYWKNKNHPNSISVCQYNKNMNLIKSYDSITSAAKETSMCFSSISNNVHGRTKTAGGFIWQLKAS